ncbi:hypothetical protein [Aquimarina aquimarini]|nr:hypothetical protein [Aquimarina aquimarini]
MQTCILSANIYNKKRQKQIDHPTLNKRIQIRNVYYHWPTNSICGIG